MQLPSSGDYTASVQTSSNFKDQDLKRGLIKKDAMGLPVTDSGNFAITYCVVVGATKWAVKCFHKDTTGLREGYARVAAFLKSNRSGLFVDFEYQDEGIRVVPGSGTASWFPIVKMRWAPGQTLGQFVDKCWKDTGAMRKAADNFAEMVGELDRLGIAHGDLQHGNVMVASDRKLQLIDYDGMYIPGSSTGGSKETGHRNYQHPDRTGSSHGPTIDRFSALTIYTALTTLQNLPDIWRAYDNDQALLFTDADFRNPSTSKLFGDLDARLTDPYARHLVSQLRAACEGSLAGVPSLSQAIDKARRNQPIAGIPGRNVFGAGRPEQRVNTGPRPLNACDRETLLEQTGSVVEVVGKVRDGATREDKNGNDIGFFNFGSREDFVIVAFSEVMDDLHDRTKTPEDVIGSWVKVSGLLERYQQRAKSGRYAKGRIAPQIRLKQANALMVIDERRARELLAQPVPKTQESGQRNEFGSSRPKAPPTPSSAPSKASSRNSWPPAGSPPSTPKRQSTPAMSAYEWNALNWPSTPQPSTPQPATPQPATPQPARRRPTQRPPSPRNDKAPAANSTGSQNPTGCLVLLVACIAFLITLMLHACAA